MQCPSCKTANPPDAAFCEQCGSKLELVCPACKAAVSPGARFCKKCGTAIAAPGPRSVKKSTDGPIRIGDITAPENIEGERKTVTALFADIKGSMDLIEDLDPEEASAVVDPALELMMEAVQHYGGYVAQSTGDGIFALFGAPIAYEDHSRRALLAALRMQQELKRYSARTRAEGRLPIQVRVGVNTGEVVVRTIMTGDAKSEYVPIGHSISLAARMQALAPIGSIATTEQVRKLCEGYFAFAGLGPTKVKGVREPVNVHEVTGLGPLRTRLQRSAIRGYTKFVGREHEMEVLRRAADVARQGHGQMVAAVAEPGVGKSRLFDEFKARNQSGWMVLEAVSVSYGKASAFVPVIDLLWNYFRIASEDDQRTRREKVTGRVLSLDRSLEDALPYLHALLGLSESSDEVAEVSPQARKRRSLEAIKRILLRESLSQPVMVIFEDLHWVDSESLAFLNLLADSIGTTRLLLMVNYRPEFRHEWGGKTYFTQLRLDPLGKETADAMLEVLLGDGKDLAPLKRLILEKSEGNPLFMEEIVQALFEDGALVRNGAVKITRSLNQLKIPPTVEAVLLSRIDRLPAEERDLLQTLAVIGQDFRLGLIVRVVGKSKDELEGMLAALQLAEFIYEQPAVGDVEYTFKHALTRDVAHNSLLLERRRLLHQRIGAALESLYSSSLDDHVADLVHHYVRSGDAQKGVKYCLRACQQCAERASYAEAVGHLETGLELLQKLPDDDRRAELELDLRNNSWLALAMTKGVASPEYLHSSARALALCQRPGINWEKTWSALYSAGLAELPRDVRRASELATELVARSEAQGSPLNIAQAVRQLASFRTIAGHFELAAEGYERAAVLLESTTDDSAWGAELNRAGSGANLWLLGYPDRAVNKMKSALAFASESGSKAALLNALHFQPFFYGPYLGGFEHARESAEALLALATELGDAFRCALSETILGWLQGEAGDLDSGIARMRRGLSALRSMGSIGGGIPYCLALPTTALARTGQFDEAFRAINEALELVERTGECSGEADLHRLRGELLLAQNTSNAAKAEQCFRTAIEIARRQHGKSWELRATTSLARLLRDTNRREDARTMLADIYNWFTEGFDTADLKDAKALLDELSA